MMKLTLCAWTILLAGLVLPSPSRSQDLPEALVGNFEEAQGKVLALAEAMPEATYVWAPAEGVRSVSQAFMHLVGANYGVLSRIGAEFPSGIPEVWYRDPESVTEKGAVLEALRASFQFAHRVLEQTPAATYGDQAPSAAPETSIISQLILLDTHAHEHLGQLIAYARMNGIAPPWSGGGEPQPVVEPPFPVEPTVLVDGAFQRCEGIAFNGEGNLFVAGNASLWQVNPDGEVSLVTELFSNLGLAPIGDRDILMADFGPTSRFDRGPNVDGIVWRITPEGEKTRVLDGGIGDPNALWVREDGAFLVSDDATDEIFIADLDGNLGLFTDAVGHPNGIAVSPDGKTLYVAQIFRSLRPLVPDGRVWALPLENGEVAGPPRLLADLGADAANDGIALDHQGRVYVAANGAGQIWRIDPASGQKVLIAEGLPGVASLAFGQGDFDHESLYATSTRTGRVWVVRVGQTGAPLHR